MENLPMTLELSPSHHLIVTLATITKANASVARIAVEQLFDNAMISAGMLDEPRNLQSRLSKVLEMFVYQGAGYDYAEGKYRTSAAVVEEGNAKTEEPKGAEEENVTAANGAEKAAAAEEGTSKFEDITAEKKMSA